MLQAQPHRCGAVTNAVVRELGWAFLQSVPNAGLGWGDGCSEGGDFLGRAAWGSMHHALEVQTFPGWTGLASASSH